MNRRTDRDPPRLPGVGGFRDRLRAFWHWPESGDLFAPLERFRARHRWPLIVYGLTLGILYARSGADRFDSWERFPEWFAAAGRAALYAIPVSFAADVLVIAAWWSALRLRALFRRASLSRDVLRRGL